VIPTIARSSHFGTAIENELNGKVDVCAFGIAGNLNAIGEGTQGSMCPAGAAVLRQVLIERVSQVGDSVHVYGAIWGRTADLISEMPCGANVP
jgi:hypothetical protein